MKHILLFGAGKSAAALIHYLTQLSAEKQWQVTVADADLATAAAKTGKHPLVTPVGVQLEDAVQRGALIQQADLVISLMPPSLHFIVATDCVRYGKHLLTASYVDEQLRQLAPEIQAKGLLFLCEMGLDPGIDHMSAMQFIGDARQQGYKINAFRSHCGGLVAPESDTNPWHYKISWNPHNVVMAGKAGAVFKENNTVQSREYNELFRNNEMVAVPGHGSYAWYPNRDSLSYIPLYGLEEAATFIRTTLRHPHFCTGWQHIIALHLTDEEKYYETDGLSFRDFFEQHLERFQCKKQMPADDRSIGQLLFLGLDSAAMINKGLCSAADVLQLLLETKLALQPKDKDLIVMLHEIEGELDGVPAVLRSTLVVKGDDAVHTAMATTVGLPLGIAARLILEGKITETGLHIPVIPSIYEPVLLELAKHGIRFTEE
jgi:saccharopine dehydrogenase-like NADP-dependent oxidoreductase